MKTSTIINAFLFIGIVIFSSSCKKKGCTDKDGANYIAGAEKSTLCQYRYGKTVTVNANNGVSYDPFDAPDLYIKFATSASPQWDYNVSVVNNTYQITGTFVNEFKFTNEDWVYEVYDQDTFDSDDLVCSGTFNPLVDGSAGNIVLINNGCTITFPYTVK
jgi:hypothetical protein